MLVLTRKQNEQIQIGSNIVIKVIATGKGKVKIGIDAPSNIRVLRAELIGRLAGRQPPAAAVEAIQPQPQV